MSLDPSQEMALTRRAARGRWNVPDKVKRASISTIQQILDDESAKPELRLAAVNTAAVLDKIDLKEIEIFQPKTINVNRLPTEELLAKLEKLMGGEPLLVESLRQKLLPRTGETQ